MKRFLVGIALMFGAVLAQAQHHPYEYNRNVPSHGSYLNRGHFGDRHYSYDYGYRGYDRMYVSPYFHTYGEYYPSCEAYDSYGNCVQEYPYYQQYYVPNYGVHIRIR